MMIFVNEINKISVKPVSIMKDFLNLLNPFAPHITEEIWSRINSNEILAKVRWPTYNEKYVKDSTVTIAVQVNGKVRGQFQIERNSNGEALFEKAISLENVRKYLNGKKIKKKIAIKNKIVSIVTD
jgi:leucyl-tRNA synthetase